MTFMHRGAVLAATSFICVAAPAQAQTRSFDIPAQSLDRAITTLGRKADIQIIAAKKLTRGKGSRAVNGNMTTDRALAVMLVGSGLAARRLGANSFTIVTDPNVAGARAETRAPGRETIQSSAQAGNEGPSSAADSDASEADETILVTGTRIDRAGFDAPTPTTVVGKRDLTLGARANVAEVLNDLPSVRPSNAPISNSTSNAANTAALDLRGLGTARTLTLLNGRRSAATADLNNIPFNLVKRVDVVTGGASAAWGSGAVAGVVNVILDDDLEGLTVAAQAGVSSRGDGARYGMDVSFGTKFADDRGHFMISANWLQNRGIPNWFARPKLGSGGTFVNPNYTPTNGQHQLFISPDVFASNAGRSGLILTGILAGQTFNADGTLRAFQFGSPRNATTMVGGEGWNTFAGASVTMPFERKGVFARASFEISSEAKLWAEGGFTRMSGSGDDYFPDSDRAITIRSDNAFLLPSVRNQLTAAGQTSFTMGRWFQDRIFQFDFRRDDIEAAIGIDGSFGNGWRYNGYYTHGEYRNYNRLGQLRIRANYLNAVDAVINPITGQPVCRIALTTANTNCVPVNLFGEGNISDQAAAYIFGGAVIDSTTKLDATGVNLRGEPFSLWAGPVSIAIGAEARWESISSKVDDISKINGFTGSNRSPLTGAFDVKEAFGEIAVPVLDIPGVNKLELNASARYSDYSNTGGIWSWKIGASDRLFDDLLLRATYSRDIRSGNMNELFTTQATAVVQFFDPFSKQLVTVTNTTGGNPNLEAERAKTLTVGGSYTPQFAPGLRLSVDYYKIKVKGVITTIQPLDLATRCFNGNTALCAQLTFNSAGSIVATASTFINLSRLETNGVDMEASYVLPLREIGDGSGSLRFRALATYVDSLVTDDGITRIQSAGVTGDNTFGTPHWRATGSIGYDNAGFGTDLRVRYVGGGVFSRVLDIANKNIPSRTYVDLGARFDVGPMTLTADIVNLFDLALPKQTTVVPVQYDVIGRYVSVGAKIRF